MIEDTCTVSIVQSGITKRGMGAYSHETLERARVWSVVHSETLEPVKMSYVVEAEGGELSEWGGKKTRKLSERARTYQHTAHRPHPRKLQERCGS